MKKDYTHICIVLDASGSMECIENDIKGSFNTFLNKQREEDGKTVFDLFQFSGEVKRLVKSADLALFKDDLMAKYTCSGMTALNDAVCTAIDTMGKEFAEMPETERPENVLCVLITDGQENASKEFSTADVKKRIEHQQDVYKWEFLFLAANQDAFEAGSALGVRENFCRSFVADSRGIACMCADVASFATGIRNQKNSMMTDKNQQELEEMQKEIEESQQDIEKMQKEMEGYEQIFTDAAQWLREKIEKDPIFAYQLPDDDEVMIKALKIVVIERNASTSYLQRKLKISYNRAAELLETMEERGIVGPLADSGKREILVKNPKIEV